MPRGHGSTNTKQAPRLELGRLSDIIRLRRQPTPADGAALVAWLSARGSPGAEILIGQVFKDKSVRPHAVISDVCTDVLEHLGGREAVSGLRVRAFLPGEEGNLAAGQPFLTAGRAIALVPYDEPSEDTTAAALAAAVGCDAAGPRSTFVRDSVTITVPSPSGGELSATAIITSSSVTVINREGAGIAAVSFDAKRGPLSSVVRATKSPHRRVMLVIDAVSSSAALMASMKKMMANPKLAGMMPAIKDAFAAIGSAPGEVPDVE
jgi:hypothetical protein